MRVSKKRVGQAIITFCMVAIASVAYAQATSTFNGRVLDQGDAVLPGVTITATNVETGVSRTTVTNAEGSYFMPGLDPGTYEVKTDLSGFAPSARQNVRLGLNATLTIDFKLALAGLNETLTVTGEAPLIEATQSKLATTIQTEEIQNLPMITRTISGMLELLPGATPITELHRTKQNVGTVSFGGSSGGNVIPTVDGADNRDNHYSGPLMSFTTESLEQFQLSSSQFTAADGRTSGAAISLITKAGTNAFHGSGFVYERDRKLTSKDFFLRDSEKTQGIKLEKSPFSRQQFGGSIGGPIIKNKMFFFGAVEQQLEDKGQFVSDAIYNQLEALVGQMRLGRIPTGYVYDKHPRIGDTPGGLRMYSGKVNAQLNNAQSIMFRYAGQDEGRDAVTWTTNNDNGQPDNFTINAFSAVAQHSYVLGNAGLNQITGQVNQMDYLADVVDATTGKHFTRDFPTIDILSPRLSFPLVNTGAGGDAGTQSLRRVYQVRDDVSLLKGTHAMKFGVNFNYLWHLGILNGNEMFATISFFDDPLTIINNTNGRYPQGFQTPGIVRQWQQANGGPVGGQGYWADTISNAQQLGTWFQDDWRASDKLTLNLGLRYDTDFNLMYEKGFQLNATRQILEAIGDPNGGYPKTPRNNASPRVGFAYDLSGDGRRVLRGGFGVYFDQYNTAASAGDITSQSKRPLNSLATMVNTAIGVGALANYRFGLDPLPAQPTEGNKLPANATGQWISPDNKSGRTYQTHVGYAHTLAANTTVSVDFTLSEGRNELRIININPILNGTRRLAPALVAHGLPANSLGNVNILSAINKSRYDGLTFLFQRRFPRATMQAHYTYAHAYAYGGSTGNRSGAPAPMVWDQPFGPGEWGPNGPDERHRAVITGVFELKYGIQFSPVLQLASARPFNLTVGTDVNADGNNNDRWIDPSGHQVSLNAGRGDPTYVFDMRSTKWFTLSGDRRVGAFVEAFNIFNTTNLGAQYQGNARSYPAGTLRSPEDFNLPDGRYIPGIGYPRQVQLGARFQF
jgi:carboxypeptidase family protein